MTAVRKFGGLTPARRWALVKAVTVVALVRVGLSVLRFPKLRAALRPARRRSPLAGIGPLAEPDDLAWAVAAAGRRIPRATCLVQALALELMLIRSGHAADIEIGVAKEGGQFEAHAWVQAEGGRRYLEDAEPARLATLPAGWRR